jgi:hypothetical protein
VRVSGNWKNELIAKGTIAKIGIAKWNLHHHVTVPNLGKFGKGKKCLKTEAYFPSPWSKDMRRKEVRESNSFLAAA